MITLEEWTKLIEMDSEMKNEYEGVNPRTREKMKEIAAKLSCRVVGDEGEEY